jgi:hypothetical protein
VREARVHCAQRTPPSQPARSSSTRRLCRTQNWAHTCGSRTARCAPAGTGCTERPVAHARTRPVRCRGTGWSRRSSTPVGTPERSPAWCCRRGTGHPKTPARRGSPPAATCSHTQTDTAARSHTHKRAHARTKAHLARPAPGERTSRGRGGRGGPYNKPRPHSAPVRGSWPRGPRCSPSPGGTECT